MPGPSSVAEEHHSCSSNALDANGADVHESADVRGVPDPSEIGPRASARDLLGCPGRLATASDSSPCVLRKWKSEVEFEIGI